MQIALLIPTYNEADNLAMLLPEIALAAKELVQVYLTVYVIDDSSPDGTAQVALDLQNQLQTPSFQIQLISRKMKEGLGKAYIDGFKTLLALKNKPNFIMQMDADRSHSPRYIAQFIQSAKTGADFVVGSRYIPGGSSPNWSWYRKLLSHAGNMYARMLLSNHVTDYTGGFNLYSSALLERLNFDFINHAGYGFLIHLKFNAQQHAQKIVEIPIQFTDREFGVSKMPLNTIFKNCYLVVVIRLKSLLP